MAAWITVAVVLSLAGWAVWRNLRRGKGEFCSICSCGACSGRCKKCAAPKAGAGGAEKWGKGKIAD